MSAPMGSLFLCVTLTGASRAVRRIEPTREFLGDHERLAS